MKWRKIAMVGGSSGGVVVPTIALRSQSSLAYAASRTNSIVPAPASIVNGDILVASVFTLLTGGAPDPTPPAGWSVFGTPTSVAQGAVNGRLNIYWKRAAGEAGSYTFTHPTANSAVYMGCYSGCKATGTPLGATSNNSGAHGTIPNYLGTSITTTAANSWLLFMAHDWGDLTNNLTPPTGMTERLDTVVMYAADQLIPTAGPTGDRTMANNNDGSSSVWAVRMIELLNA